MKKQILAIFIGLVFSLPIIIYGAAAPAGEVKIEKVGNTKGVVLIKHASHKFSCEGKDGFKCHHTGKTTDKCSKCHKDVNWKKLMHDNCTSCHIKIKKGPVSLSPCSACHNKDK